MRRALVAEHLAEATRGASWAKQKWPALAYDDCLSYANEALVVLADEYDPDLGVPFRAFIRLRIRYRIIDLWRTERRARRAAPTVTLFDHTTVDRHSVIDPAILAACASVDVGYDRVADSIDAASTIDSMQLSERERYLLVELGSGTSLREIGAALGVSESRACQIRRSIYDRLPDHGREPYVACRGVCGMFWLRDGTRRVWCSNRCRKRYYRAIAKGGDGGTPPL